MECANLCWEGMCGWGAECWDHLLASWEDLRWDVPCSSWLVSLIESAEQLEHSTFLWNPLRALATLLLAASCPLIAHLSILNVVKKKKKKKWISLLLWENCLNLNYVDLVHGDFQIYHIFLLFFIFILLSFEILILKLQLKILTYWLKSYYNI